MDLTPQPLTTTPSRSNKKFIYLLGALVLILLTAGFLIYKFNLLGNYFNNSGKSDTKMYSTTDATFMGKVVGVSGNTLSVENINGTRGNIRIAQKAFVITNGDNIETDLNKIELNKDVEIRLNLVDNELQATSLSYLSSPVSKPFEIVPPVPEAATGSASPNTP